MSTLKDLYIIGAGGFGREVAWLVERLNKDNPTWDLKGFIDDNTAVRGTLQDRYPILGGCDYLTNLHRETWVVCAVDRKSVV